MPGDSTAKRRRRFQTHDRRLLTAERDGARDRIQQYRDQRDAEIVAAIDRNDVAWLADLFDSVFIPIDRLLFAHEPLPGVEDCGWDYQAQTMLDYAVTHPQDRSRVIRLLAAWGADLERLNDYDLTTPLALACRTGHATHVQTLLELGARARPTGYAENPLEALFSGTWAPNNPAKLQLLRAAGVDLDGFLREWAFDWFWLRQDEVCPDGFDRLAFLASLPDLELPAPATTVARWSHRTLYVDPAFPAHEAERYLRTFRRLRAQYLVPARAPPVPSLVILAAQAVGPHARASTSGATEPGGGRAGRVTPSVTSTLTVAR